jgi:hypothetical protein
MLHRSDPARQALALPLSSARTRPGGSLGQRGDRLAPLRWGARDRPRAAPPGGGETSGQRLAMRSIIREHDSRTMRAWQKPLSLLTWDGPSLPGVSPHGAHLAGCGTGTREASQHASPGRGNGHGKVSPDSSRIFREESGLAGSAPESGGAGVAGAAQTCGAPPWPRLTPRVLSASVENRPGLSRKQHREKALSDFSSLPPPGLTPIPPLAIRIPQSPGPTPVRRERSARNGPGERPQIRHARCIRSRYIRRRNLS